MTSQSQIATRGLVRDLGGVPVRVIRQLPAREPIAGDRPDAPKDWSTPVLASGRALVD